MADQIDTMQPWTIKSFSSQVRDRINVAARKEGMTVGQFVERGMTAWMDNGQPQIVPVSAQPAVGDDRLKEVVEMALAVAAAAPEAMREKMILAVWGRVRANLRLPKQTRDVVVRNGA